MSGRLILAATAALFSTGAVAETLDAMRWTNRVLIISASAEGSSEIGRQIGYLDGHDGDLRERDLVVLALEGNALRAVFGTAPSAETARSLREKLKLPATERFRAVLIGKDGGVKWSSRKPAALPDINAVIDAMPMRRAGTG